MKYVKGWGQNPKATPGGTHPKNTTRYREVKIKDTF